MMCDTFFLKMGTAGFSEPFVSTYQNMLSHRKPYDHNLDLMQLLFYAHWKWKHDDGGRNILHVFQIGKFVHTHERQIHSPKLYSYLNARKNQLEIASL